LTFASLQEAKKEYIMAILFAPSWEPANKKFFLPSGPMIFDLFLRIMSGFPSLPAPLVPYPPLN